MTPPGSAVAVTVVGACGTESGGALMVKIVVADVRPVLDAVSVGVPAVVSL